MKISFACCASNPNPEQLEEKLVEVEERGFEKRSQILAEFVSDLETVFAGDAFALPEIGKDWTWFNVSSALADEHFLGRITILGD